MVRELPNAQTLAFGERARAWAGVKRNIAHFIEEKCPTMRQFEAADPLGNGAGESAFFMTNSSLSNKPVGNRSAI